MEDFNIWSFGAKMSLAAGNHVSISSPYGDACDQRKATFHYILLCGNLGDLLSNPPESILLAKRFSNTQTVDWKKAKFGGDFGYDSEEK